MNVQLADRPGKASGREPATRPAIVDCDIHPMMRSKQDLHRHLPRAWRDHLDEYGFREGTPFVAAPQYPKATPALSRRDAWPPGGGLPGSDLQFMRDQFLDPCGITFGVLHPLYPLGMQARNLDLGTAIARAVNDWQIETWLEPEPRLKGSITVNGEDAAGAVAEIDRLASDRRFVQVSMACKGIEPIGRKRYWPIYEAAAAHGLPLGLHVSGENGWPDAGPGWCSYYQEHHHTSSFKVRATATSMVLEGVFERFPGLNLILVEGGFGWIPSWGWRLDQQWRRMRSEVPHLKRPPSEYAREHIFLTTQPMEEPERPDDLRDVLEWIGWDRILFATDYPHWDFDDPALAFKCRLSDAERRRIFSENAFRLYRLG